MREQDTPTTLREQDAPAISTAQTEEEIGL
jgi:hypothetical protein